MDRAEWGDARMTQYMLHGTFRKYARAISRQGLKGGGGWKDSAYIFLVPMIPGRRHHPGLRAEADVIVKVDMGRYFNDGGVGWWTKNKFMQIQGLNYDRYRGTPRDYLVDITWRFSGDTLWSLPVPRMDETGELEDAECLPEVSISLE